MMQSIIRQPFSRRLLLGPNSISISSTICTGSSVCSIGNSASRGISTNVFVRLISNQNSFPPTNRVGLALGRALSTSATPAATTTTPKAAATAKAPKATVTAPTTATTAATTPAAATTGSASAAPSADQKKEKKEKKESGASTDKSGKGFGKNLKRKKVVRELKFPISEDAQNIYHAIDAIRKNAFAKFNETVDLAINLGVDPRKPNQAIKGVCQLPHGNGKSVRVAVFANGADAQTAIAAGAEVVGGEELIKAVMDGEINFDRVIATPEMMPMLSKIGKILGPKGLMPNPKMGTVTKDILKAVKTVKAGSVQFKVDKTAIIHAGIGKLSFSDDHLIENIRSFMLALGDSRPEGFKSKYILSCSISSTMGPGVKLDVANLDPTSPKFMVHFKDL